MNRRQFVWLGSTCIASSLALKHAAARSFLPADEVRTAHGAELPLLLGTDYYPDQTPEHLWVEDAAAMAAAGITNVRIAEFAWALMEPKEGSFDFAWLKRSIDILHAHGIAVILGTPSAAPPNWLTQKYPEVLEMNDQGVTLQPGSRRFTCPSNATYRRLSVTIATEMARTFAATPGVIGWQIDNELTLGSSGRCYCHSCREGFQQWLRSRYPSLTAMNQQWGTIFWSNTYTDFNQVPVPLPSGAPPNPGLALDYDRYQSYANVSFMEEQLTVLQRLCPQHFITTNNVSLVDTIDMRALYRKLDFVAYDNYPGFVSVVEGEAGTSLPALALASTISFGHDLTRSVKDGKPFLVMEEQSGKAGQPFFSPQSEPGQLRLWTYQAVAHGAMGINYFRWDTANSGAEEYWHGMLRHDRSHSPGFDEMVQTLRELKTLGAEALNARTNAEVAMVFDLNSSWAMTIQPGQPKLKYMSEMVPWYASLSAAQTGIDMVDARQDLSRYKVLCAPLMYIVTAEQAEKIRGFVQSGGLFISGVRLGVKDEHSRIVDTPLPGLLRDVMGVELLDYQPIYSEKQSVQFTGSVAGPNADCTLWADILTPQKAEVLATYTAGPYAGKAAVTTNTFGKGKAVYIGAHLDTRELGRVLSILMAQSVSRPTVEAPMGVEVASRSAGGKSWTYILNHNATAQTVRISGRYDNALDRATIAKELKIEAYGVRVLAGQARA